MDETFAGSPWSGEPSVDWNQPAWWNRYYQELITDSATEIRTELVVYRDCHRLTDFFASSNVLPLSPDISAPRVLDAGCGLSVVPNVLAYWGFHVTAIDSCENAVTVIRNRNPTELELAKCIKIWEPCQGMEDTFELVDEPTRSLKTLKKYKSAGGTLNYLQADWHDKPLVNGEFDFIYCANSLRRSTKPYWRETLSRFFDLLSPDGTLILETVNAIGIQSEVRGILRDVGYCPLTDNPMPNNKYVLEFWPTG